MKVADLQGLPVAFGNATNEVLAAILDQSADCIKVIGLEGTVDYMNRNGQCAMEIDDFCAVAGQKWPALWPEAARPLIEDAIAKAKAGTSSRFEGFCPTAKGTPRWWDVSVSPLRRSDGNLDGFIATSRDITDRVNKGVLRDAVAEEMRHRLRNNYVVVGSLLAAYSRGNPAQEGFVREMTDRLSTLGIAQTMKGMGGEVCPMTGLVPALVMPFATPDCPISIGALPAVELDQAQVDALALVLGELAVNSTKHGALSAHGRIKLRGSITEDAIELLWSERSNRPVTRREREGGQGLRLMTRVLAARGGSIGMDWAKSGMTATIRMAR